MCFGMDKISNMNIFKKILTISLIAVLSISQTACSINPNSKNVGYTKESFYFDTICDITLYGMAGLSDEYDDDEEEVSGHHVRDDILRQSLRDGRSAPEGGCLLSPTA